MGGSAKTRASKHSGGSKHSKGSKSKKAGHTKGKGHGKTSHGKHGKGSGASSNKSAKSQKKQHQRGSPNQPRNQPYQPAYQPQYYGGGEPEVETPEEPPHPAAFELDTLQECKRLWLEYTRNTLSVFAKNTYEYNVYESKKNRFLVVSPAQGAPDKGRGKSRPSDFSVHSANGDEIFYVKWRPGTCIHPGVLVEVLSDGVPLGTIHQEHKNMIARTPEALETMRIVGVPALNICDQRGPDNFRCEVFLTEKGLTDSVGIVGRNGAIMESVVAGEPSAFYFVAAKTPKNEFNLLQKQFILALLVTFMTQYAE